MSFPRLSNKEVTILRLLVERGPLFGLQLVDFSPELKRGTIYVTLGRMVEKSYVEVVPDFDGPRKPYRATQLGARVLAALDAATQTITDARPTRDSKMTTVQSSAGLGEDTLRTVRHFRGMEPGGPFPHPRSPDDLVDLLRGLIADRERRALTRAAKHRKPGGSAQLLVAAESEVTAARAAAALLVNAAALLRAGSTPADVLASLAAEVETARESGTTSAASEVAVGPVDQEFVVHGQEVVWDLLATLLPILQEGAASGVFTTSPAPRSNPEGPD